MMKDASKLDIEMSVEVVVRSKNHDGG